MYSYLILQNPGHNRVYYNLAAELALAELTIASERFNTECKDISVKEIKGIRYLNIQAENELSAQDIDTVSRLSFVFAIYREEEREGESCLTPVAATNYHYIDDKISSLLKYQGKTNELFTKMMINVALLSSDFNYNDEINLLDPVAGRGTTLFEATVYGFNACGIEIEPKPVADANLFFKKFIEAERYKHISDKRQVYGRNKSEAIYISEFEYAKTKDLFKDEDNRKVLGLINGNSSDADKYFKRNSFNIIVGDLPYGISHGNTTVNRGSGTRNPSELLNSCVPAWSKVLKPGGTVVLAWNSFVASRQRLTQIFESNGFTVLKSDAYNRFEHMVDKSIKRDIIVAKKNQ